MPERGDSLRAALTRTLPWGGLATALLMACLVLRFSQVSLVWHAYVAVIGLLAATTVVLAFGAGNQVADAGRRPRLRPLRRRRRPPRLRSLEELEHAADFSLTSAFDLHYRLRPHLRRIAQHRLANRGVDLDGQPAVAARLLGPAVWDLVRPDRVPPVDRHARGLSLAELRGVVDAIGSI